MLKRTPLKRKPFVGKRGPIKRKVKSQVDFQEEYNKKVSASNKMWRFFEDIWNEREHNCQNCGRYLGNIIKSFFFDHLLEKSKYPEFAHVKQNIFLVCADCHICKTNSFPKPKHRAAIEYVKQLLGIY